MKATKLTSIFLWMLLPVSLAITSCDKKANENSGADEMEIRAVHDDYVNGWLNSDEKGILQLFEENARIQPNMMAPIEGKSKIKKFWFPKDSSKTIINDYRTEIISINIIDTLALTTHKSILDWTYQKDTISFGMFQKGFNTTIYRKQPDNSWKIWRSMWTDIYVERK